MIRIPSFVAALVLALCPLVAGGGVGTSPAAHASTALESHAAHPAAAGKPRTRLVLTVRNCDGCGVDLESFPGGSSSCADDPDCHGWIGPYRVVRSGRVTFDVPRRRTRGLSIVINPPWSNVDAKSMVAFRYAGQRLGQRVSARQAAHGHRAYRCWAGTTRAKAHLTVQVARFHHSTYLGKTGWTPRLWVSPTARGYGDTWATQHGALATQDIQLCSQ